MKAIEINGKIKIYNTLPNSWNGTKHYVGGFASLSDEELKAEGFYDVVIPEYNSKAEELSAIYFDSDNEIFTYDVSDKTWSETVAELKTRRINHFKSIVNRELQKTDWYIIRSVDNGDDVPSIITDERAATRSQSDTVESEINALTTKQEVMQYDFPNVS